MKVLIIEDDKNIVEAITLAFQIRWPEAVVVSSLMGKEGVGLARSEIPDVIILDLGLPDISGFDVLKQIRGFSNVPVMIVTARGEEADVIRGLEWGADDYIVKPFRQLVLLSRIKALLRRSQAKDEQALVCGKLSLDPTTFNLNKGDKEIALTVTEGRILFELMSSCDQVISHVKLIEKVWGADYPGASHNLQVYISRLRERIELDPNKPRFIINKPGLGYMLSSKPATES